MKTTCIALFSILLAASTVIAGFTLKSGVYRMNDLDKAESMAFSEKKAMAFLYSDESTFCTQCAGASRQAMEALAGSCVMVYVHKSEAGNLPEQVKKAFRSHRAGKYIPVVVIMSYDLTKVIVIVPFARGEAYGKLLSGARAKILSYVK